MIQTTLGIVAPQTTKTSDDYYTPQWIFDALGLRFDLDVASPEGGIPWIPADRYFAPSDDGLALRWYGRVWMNPPFSRPAEWVKRFIEHRNGICIVPMSNGRWFADLWRLADAITLPAERAFEFVGGGIPIRVAMAAFSDECCNALANVGTVR